MRSIVAGDLVVKAWGAFGIGIVIDVEVDVEMDLSIWPARENRSYKVLWNNGVVRRHESGTVRRVCLAPW